MNHKCVVYLRTRDVYPIALFQLMYMRYGFTCTMGEYSLTHQMNMNSVVVVESAEHSGLDIATFRKVGRLFVHEVWNELPRECDFFIETKWHAQHSDTIKSLEFIQHVQYIIYDNARNSVTTMPIDLQVFRPEPDAWCTRTCATSRIRWGDGQFMFRMTEKICLVRAKQLACGDRGRWSLSR